MLAALAALTACSVEQGGRLFQPTPSGNVEVRLVGGSSNPINSGPKHPVVVHGGFSLNVNEAWYTNYFTGAVVSWAPSDGDCFAAPAKANNTVLTFTLTDECQTGKDVVGIRVSDIYGNGTTQYFQLK